MDIDISVTDGKDDTCIYGHMPPAISRPTDRRCLGGRRAPAKEIVLSINNVYLFADPGPLNKNRHLC
jgi:hypothetical protein